MAVRQENDPDKERLIHLSDLAGRLVVPYTYVEYDAMRLLPTVARVVPYDDCVSSFVEASP